MSVHMKVYLDVLFLINLVVNTVLLSTVCALIRKPVKLGSVILAGAAGAFGVCLLWLLPVEKSAVVLLPAHLVTSTIMVKIGCKVENVREWVRAVLLLYLAAFLWGGMFLALHGTQMVVHIPTFCLFSAVIYLLLRLLLWSLARLQQRRSHFYEVTLYAKGKSMKVKGLYDTGNQLVDPYTGKAVSVLSKKDVCTLLGNEDLDQEDLEQQDLHLRYIPFHAIGTEQGMMPAITLSWMLIHREGQEILVTEPVIAMSEEGVSQNRHYQMILNPNLIDNQEE